MLNCASKALATPPTATRIAVSRALAFSRTFLMSRCAYLMAPTRSACPGRGRVTTLSAGTGPGSTAMTSFQFSQSLFAIINPIGLPSVWPSEPRRRTQPDPPRAACVRPGHTPSGAGQDPDSPGRGSAADRRAHLRGRRGEISRATRPHSDTAAWLMSHGSALHDGGREEDQQFLPRDRLGFVLEQPAQHRDAGEVGDTGHGVDLAIHEDPADHHRLAIADHHLGVRFPLVDAGPGRIASGTHGVPRGPDFQKYILPCLPRIA